MAKRLTPFIGLAVVAALALAAAFGAFSLSPAYAGVETPDARGLTVTEGFSPQTYVEDVDGDDTNGSQPGVADGGSSTAVFTVEGTRTDIEVGDGAPGAVRLPMGQTLTVNLSEVLDGPVQPAALAIDTVNAFTTDDGDLLNNVISLSATPAGAMATSIYTGDIAASLNPVLTITPKAVGSTTVTVTGIDGSTSGVTPLNSTYAFQVVVVANGVLDAGSNNPNSNTRYTLTLYPESQLDPGQDVVINMEDFGLPTGLLANRINMQTDAYYASEGNRYIGLNAVDGSGLFDANGVRDAIGGAYQAGVINPRDVLVDGDDLRITLPDVNPETDRSDSIMPGDMVTISISQGAGVRNPTEGDDYSVEITNTVDDVSLTTNEVTVVRRVVLSEEDGGRGTEVTATGSGFKNGTTLGFFLDLRTVHVDDDNDDSTPAERDNGVDDDNMNGADDPAEFDGVTYRLPSGERETGEVVLCDVAQIGGNDVGSCTFTVSNPPFTPGDNFVGAVDGRSNYASKSSTNNDGDQRFVLKPSISVTPTGGNPGETILVQGFDFPQGSVTRVRLARQDTDAQGRDSAAGLAADITGSSTVGSNGDISFRVVIPNWAAEGVQDLQVTAGGESDNVNITVGGPRITVTPEVVLANQRISLVGTGFTPNSRISGGNGGTIDPSVTIGGYEIPMANINEGDPVTVDNGGKWSASLDMPLRDVTTRDGAREIRVSDSGGRSGTVDVNIPARSVTIDPASGRTGTTATVRGENFPSRNDNGLSFNISIAYDTGSGRPTTVSTVSDASGRFEEEIRIPTSATIPSTNTVRVSFLDEEDVEVTTTVTHDVPEGTLTLSATSGAPGSTVTLRGEGFKTFVPVKSVSIGSIDVLPSPAPATDAQGGLEFDLLIPGLDSGIQTIEVEVSDTTASIGFTVTTAAQIGAETRVEDGLVNLGDNFLRAFNFDNDTKSWTFYDPAAGDASTMTHFIAGSSYWILVTRTEQVILNRETRNLTCVDGNCWNLITW